MTILDFLKKAAGEPFSKLVEILRAGAAAQPDLAPAAEWMIAKLNDAVPLSNLVALAEAIPRELAAIAQGKIDPRDHPSDAA